MYGAVNVVSFFLDLKGKDRSHLVDPSITNNFGWSPLHGAAPNGHFDCAELLLKHHANPSPISDTRKTPLDLVLSGQKHYYRILTGEKHYKYEGLVKAYANNDEQKDNTTILLKSYNAITSTELYEKIGSKAFNKEKYSHKGWSDLW